MEKHSLEEGEPFPYGYFKLAQRVSRLSDHRVRVGAVLCNKKPISVACNSKKTHPIHANPYNSIRSSLHAECRAIMGYRGSLKGSTIYVYRETKSGHPALARPCNYCLTILKMYDIKRMIFTIDSYPYWREEFL